MIICSCNVLSDTDMARAADEIRATPGGRIVTPGGVFKRLGCRPQCGNCFPLVVKVIHESEGKSDAQMRADQDAEPCSD